MSMRQPRTTNRAERRAGALIDECVVKVLFLAPGATAGEIRASIRTFEWTHGNVRALIDDQLPRRVRDALERLTDEGILIRSCDRGYFIAEGSQEAIPWPTGTGGR